MKIILSWHQSTVHILSSLYLSFDSLDNTLAITILKTQSHLRQVQVTVVFFYLEIKQNVA